MQTETSPFHVNASKLIQLHGTLNIRWRWHTPLCHWSRDITLLPPATKLRQGNVFTPVCHSVHGEVSASGPGEESATHTLGRHPLGRHPPCADTPPLLGRHPPTQCMLGYGQQAGGKHPTGIHSYLVMWQVWLSTGLDQFLGECRYKEKTYMYIP